MESAFHCSPVASGQAGLPVWPQFAPASCFLRDWATSTDKTRLTRFSGLAKVTLPLMCVRFYIWVFPSGVGGLWLFNLEFRFFFCVEIHSLTRFRFLCVFFWSFTTTGFLQWTWKLVLLSCTGFAPLGWMQHHTNSISRHCTVSPIQWLIFQFSY